MLDTNDAMHIREGTHYGFNPDPAVVRILTEELHTNNVLARRFFRLGEVMQQDNVEADQVYMVICHRYDEDIRQYNNPLTHKIAAIYSASDENPPATDNVFDLV